jgi:hypothetical protein
MKRNLFPFILLLISAAVACNLPGLTDVAETVSFAVRTPGPAETLPAGKKATWTPTTLPTATITYPPADLPFTIDCSALPASRQADCESFLAATRDIVYPMERELTGVSLSQCYKEIRYIILPEDPRPGAGGISSGDVITYNQRYSIDLDYRYDPHEILHSISGCGRALDLHVFHGMIMNAVYDRLGVSARGYYEARSSENLNAGLEAVEAEARNATGANLTNLCIGILMRKMTIAYFDLGEGAITELYRSTIAPFENLTPPDARQVEIWGGYAPQVDALLEKLVQEYKYPLDIPSCGFPGT